MKLTEKIGLSLVYVLIGVGIYLARYDLAFYEGVYVREDGLIEWLTVTALMGCSLICFYRANILRSFRKTPFILTLVFMGILFLCGAAEEISWGQRLIGFKSPEFFIHNNSQMEFNFHNLIIGGAKVNKILFGTGLGIIIAIYFLILPILYRKKESIQKLINSLAIPVPRWLHISLYLLLFILVQLIPSSKKGEILEFGGTWIFFFLLLEPFNRSIFSRRSLKR